MKLFFFTVFEIVLAFSSFSDCFADPSARFTQEDPLSTVAPQAVNGLFIPTDSIISFTDVSTIALDYIDNFDSLLPSFPQCSFFDIPSRNSEASKALGDHFTTWSEYAKCLNAAGTYIGIEDQYHVLRGLYSKIPTRHGLWTSAMEPYIKREVVSKQVIGSPFSRQQFFYEVVPGYELAPANLALPQAQRYVNYRCTHYWLNYQLHQEEALCKGEQPQKECDDNLTVYFRKKGLYPVIDPFHNRDNAEGILAESTEVGCYYFSPDGNSVTSIDPEATYCLPTHMEKYYWDKKNTPQTSLEGNSWIHREDLKNQRAPGAFESAPQTGMEEAFIQLAVNKKSMMADPNFAAQEAKLMNNVQNMNEGLLQMENSSEYQEGDFYERARLEKDFFDIVGVFGFFLGASDLYYAWKGISEMHSAGYWFITNDTGPFIQVVLKKTFTQKDYELAGFTKENAQIYAEDPEQLFHTIATNQKQREDKNFFNNVFGCNTNDKFNTIDKFNAIDKFNTLRANYISKLHAQQTQGLIEFLCSFCAFYFGNSINIDTDY